VSTRIVGDWTVIRSLVLTLILLAVNSAHADYGLQYGVQVFPLNTGDPSHFYVSTTLDSETSGGLDSGVRISDLAPQCAEYHPDPPHECLFNFPTGYGAASSHVDLASARLSVRGSAGGYFGMAATRADLYDELTFSLPEGMTEAVIGFGLAIYGSASPRRADGSCRVTGHFSINVGGSIAYSGNSPFCADSFVGRTLGGSLTVQDGSIVPVVANVTVSTDATFDEEYSYDLTSSGYVGLILPEGVAFTSQSGVFLLPEPALLQMVPLLSAWLIFLGRRKSRLESIRATSGGRPRSIQHAVGA
jgi:hypothetical protein